MTFHARPAEAGSPLALSGRYTLGMPHLCPNGLSENWLWKELGHRHWALIGQAFGRAATGFGPEGEPPVYAAFRHVALTGGDLCAVRENDVLSLDSTLARVSGTRVVSRHRASRDERPVAEVEMTSVFVRRRVAGENRSVARVAIGRFPERPVPEGGTPAHRPRRGGTGPDGSWDVADELGTVLVEPCPHLDFNGAGLLYFSSYMAAIDRAEWRILGKTGRLHATRRREAVFHSNIEIGDDLVVRISGRDEGTGRRHAAQIRSAADGRLLAEVATQRVAG